MHKRLSFEFYGVNLSADSVLLSFASQSYLYFSTSAMFQSHQHARVILHFGLDFSSRNKPSSFLTILVHWRDQCSTSLNSLFHKCSAVPHDMN